MAVLHDAGNGSLCKNACGLHLGQIVAEGAPGWHKCEEGEGQHEERAAEEQRPAHWPALRNHLSAQMDGQIMVSREPHSVSDTSTVLQSPSPPMLVSMW